MAPKVAVSVETLQVSPRPKIGSEIRVRDDDLRAVHVFPQRLQWYVNWFQQKTAGVNWYRIAFIFLPAIIRGELSAITLYLPFIFGKISDFDDNQREINNPFSRFLI
jgi:hypothetical protein